MEILVGAGFLLVTLVLLNTTVQDRLKRCFFQYPTAIFGVPWLLTISACLIAAHYSTSVPDFINAFCLVSIYIFLPVFLLYESGSWYLPKQKEAHWIEFLVMLCLWLPIEYAMWNGWLSAHFHHLAHIIASGTAVILALCLFLLFRGMTGMKYNLPRGHRDFILPFYGLLAAAAILIPFGLMLGFIGPFRIPADLSFIKTAKIFGGIIIGIALPEEILFRGLIQNWLMQKFGASNMTIFAAALIFGLAHLNNGPQALPNWRYMFVATVAGFIYGKVFQKSSSIFSSAGLHASVNTIRHLFFV
ncbi:MAG: CPBP family intramembrane metalloprotease [Candidatus Yanofskybacteria bacterium]|nr:CPBP family intramembrane metalloprotease [Candidatus Yanofskybacteria bacterium]